MSDPVTTNVSTESKRPHEKLMPQTSIRFFFALIALSAVVMLIFRLATSGAGVARIVTLLISTIAGCFVAYAIMFLVGNLFSTTASPLTDTFHSAIDPDSLDQPAALGQSDSNDRETS